MTQITVKITKAPSYLLWYAGDVGRVFKVSDRGDAYVLPKDWPGQDTKAIRKADCEVVEVKR